MPRSAWLNAFYMRLTQITPKRFKRSWRELDSRPGIRSSRVRGIRTPLFFEFLRLFYYIKPFIKKSGRPPSSQSLKERERYGKEISIDLRLIVLTSVIYPLSLPGKGSCSAATSS
jgi:hypothetical protein